MYSFFDDVNTIKPDATIMVGNAKLLINLTCTFSVQRKTLRAGKVQGEEEVTQPSSLQS